MSKTPSERIHLIQEITEKLSIEDWPIIDLTLTQFNLPTTDQWNQNDQRGYIINMVGRAEDEILAQLHFHLTGQKSNEYPSESLSFWQPGQFRVFISHVSKHKDLATEICSHLNKYHISSFIAHKDIQPAKEWMDEIYLALQTCDCVISMMTEEFHESKWTDQEVGISMGLNKLIIPVDLGSEVYGFLSKYQWLKAGKMTAEDISSRVFDILNTHNLSKKKFSEAIVNKFESSYSFSSAKENTSLLERLEYLDAELISRIQIATRINGQINQSFGVSERIRRLIEKVEKI